MADIEENPAGLGIDRDCIAAVETVVVPAVGSIEVDSTVTGMVVVAGYTVDNTEADNRMLAADMPPDPNPASLVVGHRSLAYSIDNLEGRCFPPPIIRGLYLENQTA
jgi:hypothetical protein